MEDAPMPAHPDRKMPPRAVTVRAGQEYFYLNNHKKEGDISGRIGSV
jgi:hypothetical protein